MSRTEHLYMPEQHMHNLYYSKNPLVRYVHRNRVNTIIKLIPKVSKLKILDAGCGEGHLLEFMHKKYATNQYYGIDISDVALKSAMKRCSFAKIKKGDLSNTEYKNNYFNLIVCTEVIEHIYEAEQVVKEFKRILAKNGILIITFPNEFLWTLSRVLLLRNPFKVPDHVNSFSPKNLQSLVNLKLKNQINLPFNLPFCCSLGSLMVFQK